MIQFTCYKFYAGQEENEMSSTASKSMPINPDIYPWTCPSKQKVQVQHCFHKKQQMQCGQDKLIWIIISKRSR